MNEEGFIKFNCTRKDVSLEIPQNIFDEFSKWRKILYEKSLIWAYANGIGYGNIIGGHEEDIITRGKTLEDAGKVVMGYYNGLNK